MIHVQTLKCLGTRSINSRNVVFMQGIITRLIAIIKFELECVLYGITFCTPSVIAARVSAGKGSVWQVFFMFYVLIQYSWFTLQSILELYTLHIWSLSVSQTDLVVFGPWAG